MTAFSLKVALKMRESDSRNAGVGWVFLLDRGRGLPHNGKSKLGFANEVIRRGGHEIVFKTLDGLLFAKELKRELTKTKDRL